MFDYSPPILLIAVPSVDEIDGPLKREYGFTLGPFMKDFITLYTLFC